MTLAAGYVAVTVILALILFATFRYLWPSMEPYEPPNRADELTVELSLSRLRDTGGYLGGVHVDCLRARAAGDEICDECVPMLRVGAS